VKIKYKKIKICILGPFFLDDLLKRKHNNSFRSLGTTGAPYLSIIARSMSKNNKYDISVVSLSSNMKKSINVKNIGKIKAYFCPERAHHIRFNGSSVGKIFDLFNKEINYLLKAINIIKPDIILSNWAYEYTHAAHRSKIKYITINHDVPHKIFYYIPTILRFVKFMMAKYILKKVKNIITPSEYLKKETKKYSDTNIKVIFNPVEKSFFLKKKNIKKDKKIKKILMISNGFGAHKNIKKAITSFPYLLKKDSSYRLYIYGSMMGKNEACYNWAIKEKIDLKNIIFKGYVDNYKLPNIYKKSFIHLSTSLEETFGLTYAEAMASGTPIIAGKNSGATKEIIQNCGILVDVKSSKSIINGILRYNNKKIYEKKRILGLKRAKLFFNTNNITKEYFKHIENILNKDI